MKDSNDKIPISFRLNSRLIKKDEQCEDIYKVGGKYSNEIEKIVFLLEITTTIAENAQQLKMIQKLIEFYKTGGVKVFDEFNMSV
jgi:dipeptidyl-peptidase-3